MRKPVIRPGTLEDAIDLAPRLRPEDALELALSTGKPVSETLIESVQTSTECFAAVVGGSVIALGGFALMAGEQRIGVPWLVGSPEMPKHPITLIAAARAAVNRWESKCDVMANVTHAENTVHHKWLRHIGFSFLPEMVLLGPSQAPFMQFYRYK